MPSPYSPQDPGQVTEGDGSRPGPSEPGAARGLTPLADRGRAPRAGSAGRLGEGLPRRARAPAPTNRPLPGARGRAAGRGRRAGGGRLGLGSPEIKAAAPLLATPHPCRAAAHLLLCHNVFQSGEANCPIRAGASSFHLCRRLINMLLLAAADKFQKQVVKGFCLYPAWKMRGVTSREHE